jgi:hypothetical protein
VLGEPRFDVAIGFSGVPTDFRKPIGGCLDQRMSNMADVLPGTLCGLIP